MPRKRWPTPALAVAFAAGVLVGGYVMRDVRPRSFFALDRCDHCWEPQQVAGILGAIGMRDAPGAIPGVVLETERSIALRWPTPSDHGRPHFVVIPKRDIPDMAHLSVGDEAYLIDAYAVLGELVRRQGIRHYKVWTNGVGEQTVNYLHFHLSSYDGVPGPAAGR